MFVILNFYQSLLKNVNNRYVNRTKNFIFVDFLNFFNEIKSLQFEL